MIPDNMMQQPSTVEQWSHRRNQLSASIRYGKFDAAKKAKSHAQQVKTFINLQSSSTINQFVRPAGMVAAGTDGESTATDSKRARNEARFDALLKDRKFLQS